MPHLKDFNGFLNESEGRMPKWPDQVHSFDLSQVRDPAGFVAQAVFAAIDAAEDQYEVYQEDDGSVQEPDTTDWQDLAMSGLYEAAKIVDSKTGRGLRSPTDIDLVYRAIEDHVDGCEEVWNETEEEEEEGWNYSYEQYRAYLDCIMALNLLDKMRAGSRG
jgi:hypothetical protein